MQNKWRAAFATYDLKLQYNHNKCATLQHCSIFRKLIMKCKEYLQTQFMTITVV